MIGSYEFGFDSQLNKQMIPRKNQSNAFKLGEQVTIEMDKTETNSQDSQYSGFESKCERKW
jgi:hypothetical protein